MATDLTTRKHVRVAVTVSKDFMAGSILLRMPQDEDGASTVEEVMQKLAQADVVFGID